MTTPQAIGGNTVDKRGCDLYIRHRCQRKGIVTRSVVDHQVALTLEVTQWAAQRQRPRKPVGAQGWDHQGDIQHNLWAWYRNRLSTDYLIMHPCVVVCILFARFRRSQNVCIWSSLNKNFQQAQNTSPPYPFVQIKNCKDLRAKALMVLILHFALCTPPTHQRKRMK